MTRYEKEKAILMVLGLNEGDIVNVTYFSHSVKLKIITFADHYALGRLNGENIITPSQLYLPITDLVKYDFVKVLTLGSMVCADMECEKCPFWENVTCLGGMNNTLYDVLEISKKHNVANNEKYEEIKNALDKEVENGNVN